MQKHLQLVSEKSNSLLKYGIAALIVAIPLYPKFPLFTLPGVTVSVRLEDFLIFFVFVLWGISTFPRIKETAKDPIVRAIMLFLFVGFASVVTGAFLTKTLELPVGMLHWIRRIEYISCFLIGLSGVRSKKDIAFYLKAIMVVILIATVVGIGQKHFNWPVITTQNEQYARGVALRYLPGGHLVSTFAGHYDMASYMVLTLPVLYVLLFSPNKVIKSFAPGKPIVIRALLLIVIISGLWLLVNAASRISIVAYLGSVSFALLLARRVRFIPIVIVISLIFTSFSSNLIDRYTRIIEVTIRELMEQTMTYVDPGYIYAADEDIEIPKRRERPDPTPAPPPPVFEDRSTSIRLNVSWPRAVRAVQKNPLFGTGYSSLTLATDNGYLRLLGEVGIVGFLAFTLIGLQILLELVRRLPIPKNPSLEDVWIVGLFASIPGILLIMVFIDILEASKLATMFWLLMGISVALARLEKKNA